MYVQSITFKSCHTHITELAFWQGLTAQGAVNNAFLVITRLQKVTRGGYIDELFCWLFVARLVCLSDEQADPNNSSKNSKCYI